MDTFSRNSILDLFPHKTLKDILPTGGKDDILSLLDALMQKVFLNCEEIYDYINKKGEILIFGGALRDIYVWGNNKKSRDIDLVISGFSNSGLESLMKRSISRKTRFGGLQCVFNEYHVDIWGLDETWAFKEKYFEPKIENLPKSVFLSIDAVIYNLQSKKIYENGFYDSISKKEIDIVFEPNPYPALCIIRALVNRRKYDFNFSESLCDYIVKNFYEDPDIVKKLKDIQLSHYGIIKLTNAEIFNEIEKYVWAKKSFSKIIENAIKLKHKIS